MKQHTVTLRNRDNLKVSVGEDETIIDAVENLGYLLPVGCRYGGCITCAAKLINGKVKQPNATALNKRQSQDGYILLCVARPQTSCVIDVGVESHDTLYQNPFMKPGALDNVFKEKKNTFNLKTLARLK